MSTCWTPGPRRALTRVHRGLIHLAASRWTLPALGALIALFFATDAFARPGGGHSYSGGGSSRSGGGSSGGGDGLGILIWLVFQHPVIGIPVLIVVVIVFFMSRSGQAKGWASGGSPRQNQSHYTGYDPARLMRPHVTPRQQLQQALRHDENFSPVLFEDFAYALYSAAHEARGDGQLERLGPYLTEGARRVLAGLPPVDDVFGVIVGSMSITQVTVLSATNETAVQVRFEANYTEKRAGQARGQYVNEVWVFARSNATKSKAPGELNVHQCPNCGAAQEKQSGRGTGTCAYCNERVDTGAYDWVVRAINVLNRQPRGPQLVSHAPEVGNYLPTRYAPDVEEAKQALAARDPTFDIDQLGARTSLIYHALNTGWSERRWEYARPFVTDELFQMQRYWIDEYKKQKLVNRMDDARLIKAEVAAVTHDKFYDAVTVRLHATAKDYTTKEDGTVLAGSKSRPRAYSEYWTLIRRSGVHKAPTTTLNCPSCGAGLDKMSMAAECGYCGATVSGGDFDWVLSRIEQDESYLG